MYVAWQTCATRFTCFARIGTGGTRPIKWTGSRGSWRAYGGRSRGQHSQRAHTKARPTEGKGLRSARIKTRGAGPSKMNQMSRGFKKWCLPSKSLGIREEPESSNNTNREIRTIIQLLSTYKDEQTEEIADNIKAAVKGLRFERGLVFLRCYKAIQEQLEISANGSDSDSEINGSDSDSEIKALDFERDLPVKWDGYQAKTMVSHMIYSQKNGEPKRKLDHSPLMYVLEDPRTGRGENLVQVYRGVDIQTREYRLPMRMIWDNIREFMELDSGEFVAETLRAHDDNSVMSEEGHYAQEQMIQLKNVMSTAVLQEHTAGRVLGVQYKGDMLNSLNFLYDGGEVVMNVCDGLPDFGDLNPFLYPEEIREIVSDVLQKWKDSSPGLFVSIIWKATNGETGEHYMYMSEYQRAKLHATIAKGSVYNWKNLDSTGKPIFEAHQVAIDSLKGIVRTPHNIWEVPMPLQEGDVMYDMAKYISHGKDFRFMKHILNEITINNRTQALHKIFRVYFFSGDNLTFCVMLFNTNIDFIRDLLHLENIDSDTSWYTVTLVVRYPVVKLNIDQVMINIRRKYFMRYSPNPNKWDEWLHEEWHIPGERRWDDPQKYQVQPDFNDPLQTKVERDSNGNIVYPLRLLEVLPPGASWQVLHSRHRSMSTSFFVNNVDPDPFVVHRRSVESTAEWDHIQLFRINAETMISRMGYERHNQTFFNFRTEGLNARARGHPFKAYLEKYPDLQPEWRALWLEKYPNMYGWTQLGELGERNARNRRGRNRDQPQQRQQTRRQGRHHAQGQRQQPRSQGHRQQPRSQGQRQQPRSQGQGQAQGRRARRRQRASNNAPRNAPRNGARLTQKLRWPTNPKRVLSERRQNEKYLVHLMYDCLKAQ